MSKLTQISLDFGQEPQAPPPDPAPSPAASDGAGEASARPYMTAGGVGVRIKAYKQTPTPQTGDLFGGAPAGEKTDGPAEVVIPAEVVVPAEVGASDEAAEPVEAGVSEPVEEPLTAEEQAAALEAQARAFEERVMASRQRAGLSNEWAEASNEQSDVSNEQAESSNEWAEPVPEPSAATIDQPNLISPTIDPPNIDPATIVPPNINQPNIDAPNIDAPTIVPPTKRTPATKRAAAAKQGPSKRGRKSLKQVAAEADLIEIPQDEILFSKQYYTMGEVSGMFRVNQSLLRFWETEFDILQPRKNKKGDRYFRPLDIKNLHLIYHLLRQKKYTIEGAKEFLKNNKKAEERFEVIQRLQQIKAFLQEMKAQL